MFKLFMMLGKPTGATSDNILYTLPLVEEACLCGTTGEQQRYAFRIFFLSDDTPTREPLVRN